MKNEKVKVVGDVLSERTISRRRKSIEGLVARPPIPNGYEWVSRAKTRLASVDCLSVSEIIGRAGVVKGITMARRSKGRKLLKTRCPECRGVLRSYGVGGRIRYKMCGRCGWTDKK